MTGGRLLARNSALNLLGQFLPMLAAIVAVPILVHALGADRFGILTLAWAIVGYFGFFDFGIGRALTKAASEALASGDPETLARLGAVALPVMFALGAAGGLLLAGGTHWLIYHALHVPADLRPEAAGAFYILAASLPFVVMATGYRGLMEAHQHFGILNAVRVPFGVLSYVGPVLVLPFSHSVVAVVAMLTLARVGSLTALVIACTRRYTWLRLPARGDSRELLPLFRTGGWMTVSNVIGPLMVNLDRFMIGALLDLGAVAYYTVPFDAVVKIQIAPTAISGVFFPAFASAHRTDRAGTAPLFERSTRMILLCVFPAMLVTVALAHPILQLWVGAEYANASARVLQWLSVGMFLGCIGFMPLFLVQAADRADFTAKLSLAEVPLYVALVVLLARTYGIVGVAAAFTLRTAFDLAALYWMSRHVMENGNAVIRRFTMQVVIAVAVLACAMLPSSLAGQSAFVAVTLAIFAVTAWRVFFTRSERETARRVLGSRLRLRSRAAQPVSASPGSD